jgi:hypothetical protein
MIPSRSRQCTVERLTVPAFGASRASRLVAVLGHRSALARREQIAESEGSAGIAHRLSSRRRRHYRTVRCVFF